MLDIFNLNMADLSLADIDLSTKKNESDIYTVFASGRAFPIWNTKSGDDKLLSLSIHGLTEQIGTPTPANPVPMRSVGDSWLFLSVMPDKEGSDYQLLNIKAAMKKAGHDVNTPPGLTSWTIFMPMWM